MPTRLLYEKITVSVTLAELTADEERFFYRLLVKCDDHGRFHAHPAILLGQLFSLQSNEITTEHVGRWRQRLEDVGLIRTYLVDGREYLAVVTWAGYQRQRASSSKFPEPPSSGQPRAAVRDGAHVPLARRLDRGPVPGNDTRGPVPGSRGPARAQQRGPALANEPQPGESRRAKSPPPDHLEPTSSEYRLGETVGLSRGQVDEMAVAMLDHYRAIGELRADWHSTLRGWIRKSPMFDQDARAQSQQINANGNGIYGEIVTVEGIRT